MIVKRIKGISVSDGVAIGYARIVEKEHIHIETKKISKTAVNKELKRFHKDVEYVINELNTFIQDDSFSKENRDILTTHKMILQDPAFIKRVKELITQKLFSLEHAVSTYFTEVVNIFDAMENEYYSQRLTDFEDVAYRLLSHSMNKSKDVLAKLDDKSILIMKNITPSFVTKVFEKNIRGLCTEKGSKNSHSSIIARSMNLPMLVGISGLLENINEGEQIIVDGNNGEIIIFPSSDVLAEYKSIYLQESQKRKKLQKLINVKAITLDNKEITLMSNIELPEEIDQVIKNNSRGIGLFRTEFLFMDTEKLPTEEEQYKIYKKIAEKLAPEPVIIRTIDVGGDKLSSILNIVHEENPNLGFRGIRISLANIPIFRRQIRAILRANTKGNVKIMFPMISGVEEILQVKKIIEECKNELKKKKIAFCNDIEIGAMIEVPSAVITSDALAKECDFLSIGTNDLVQYLLAVDRDNESISFYYKSCHPSVLKAIKQTVDNAHAKGIKVAVCGEMASDIQFVKLLLGLGVDELSVSPGRILMTKNEIINCHVQNWAELAEELMELKTSDEIYERLNDSKNYE